MPKLELLMGIGFLAIAVNAIIFALLHIIYSNDYVSLLMIFAAGLGFAGMYLYYPNLILIALSHSVLNFIAVLFGFYSEEGHKNH